MPERRIRMLISGNCAFIHIPKCGGTAIRSVLKGHDVGKIRPLGNQCPVISHWHWLSRQVPARRIFTVVRHPADWIASYWADQSPIRVRGKRYLHRFWSDDIDQFAINLCNGYPGYVSALYAACTAYSGMRVFRLEDGLDRVLSWATGTERSVPAVNRSPARPALQIGTRELIATVEKSAMDRFGYLQ